MKAALPLAKRFATSSESSRNFPQVAPLCYLLIWNHHHKVWVTGTPKGCVMATWSRIIAHIQTALSMPLIWNHGDECHQVKRCVMQSQSWQKSMWTLQWRHMIIITTATRSFVQQFVQVNKTGNTKAPHYWPFARGTTDGGIFPSQEPVMRKAFLCRNVFMLTKIDVEYNACLMFKHTLSSKMICVYIIGIEHWK